MKIVKFGISVVLLALLAISIRRCIPINIVKGTNGFSINTGEKSKHNSQGFLPIAPTGEVQWVIDNKSVTVENTYYLNIENELQYTFEVKVPQYYNFSSMTKEQHEQYGLPFALYAYKNKKHKALTVAKMGEGVQGVTSIGVVLLNESGPRVQGYRLRFTLDELKEISSNTQTVDVEVSVSDTRKTNEYWADLVTKYDKSYLISKLPSVHGKDLHALNFITHFTDSTVSVRLRYNTKYVSSVIDTNAISEELKKLVSSVYHLNTKHSETFSALKKQGTVWIKEWIESSETAYDKLSAKIQGMTSKEDFSKMSSEIEHNLGDLQEVISIRSEYYEKSHSNTEDLINNIYLLKFDNKRTAGVQLHYFLNEQNDWEIVGYKIQPL